MSPETIHAIKELIVLVAHGELTKRGIRDAHGDIARAIGEDAGTRIAKAIDAGLSAVEVAPCR